MASDSSERLVLLDYLADEFAERFRRGERPSLQEYIDRHETCNIDGQNGQRRVASKSTGKRIALGGGSIADRQCGRRR